MLGSLLKVAAATLLYVGVHTFFACRPVKEAATRLLGERRRNAIYRPFYLTQSAVGFVTLMVYIARQPSRPVWQARGPVAFLMLAGQGAGGLLFLWSLHAIGWGRFFGKPGWVAYRSGCPHVPREPESQAAYLGNDGKMHADGPLRLSRNATNFAVIPLFWLSPRMTDTWALFNSIVTVYLVTGSYHAEWRMRQLYGKPMEEYQHSGVPFFIPTLRPLLEAWRDRSAGE